MAAALVVVAVHVVFPDGGPGEVTYLGVLIGAAVSAVWGAWKRPPATRVAWCWIASGVVLSALGDVAYRVYVHLGNPEPDVSIADVPWLASYAAIAVGLFMLRAARRVDRRDIDGLIDLAVVAVVSLLVIWQVSVQATITDASLAPGVRAVWSSYPIFDAMLLALLVRTALGRRVRTSGMALLAGGVACWLFADFFYTLFPSSTAWAGWLDAGWMVGAVLLAAATWTRTATSGDPSVAHDAPAGDQVGAGRIALAIAPLLVPGSIEAIGFAQGNDPDPLPMLAASIVLAGLAFTRALRLLRRTESVQAELRETEELFRALVLHSSDAAMVLEPDGTIRYVSPVATAEFGYDTETLIGRVGWELIHPDDLLIASDAFAQLNSGGDHASAELRVRDAAGEWRWVEEVVTNLRDEPAVKGLVVNIRDISTRKAAELALSRLAHYDRLTGLPNRWLLTARLEAALDDGDDPVALLIIDLDQFKFVNDSRGHATGDLLLQAVASRLTHNLPNDTVARLGGDEFAVLCLDVADPADATTRSGAVLDALQEPFELEGGLFYVSASIGIACAQPRTPPSTLLQQADTAMYAAKNDGRGRAVVFDDRLRSQADERLTIEADLRSALASEGLIVHYQPVVDLMTNTMVGVEALVRWRHPTRGLLMPGAFIPIAEQSSLIERIGSFVLRQACEDASWWARAGAPLSVAVNISAAQLCQEQLCDVIQTALYDSGLAPGQLVLEITETALLVGAERAMANADALRDLGVHVALDDFGTGYSSLAYLKRVPADIVKIDRSFVEGVADSSVDRDIVAAIIDLAHALGRTVIAEGIETAAQHAQLRDLGCPLAQGYLWSPGVAAEDILPLAASGFGPPAVASRPAFAAPAVGP